MRLLGNLDGISPASYPRPVFDLVGQLVHRAGLGPLAFVVVHNDTAQPPVPPAVHNASSVSTGTTAGAGTLDDTASSFASQAQRLAASNGAGAHAAPCGSAPGNGAHAHSADVGCAGRSTRQDADVWQAVRRAQREELRRGTYRGRARVGRVWLSSTHYGDRKRVVKARCAEELLAQLQGHSGLLQAVCMDDGGAACDVQLTAGNDAAACAEEAWLWQLQGRLDQALDAKLPGVRA